jgi:hypothetical protein
MHVFVVAQCFLLYNFIATYRHINEFLALAKAIHVVNKLQCIALQSLYKHAHAPFSN